MRTKLRQTRNKLISVMFTWPDIFNLYTSSSLLTLLASMFIDLLLRQTGFLLLLRRGRQRSTLKSWHVRYFFIYLRCAVLKQAVVMRKSSNALSNPANEANLMANNNTLVDSRIMLGEKNALTNLFFRRLKSVLMPKAIIKQIWLTSVQLKQLQTPKRCWSICRTLEPTLVRHLAHTKGPICMCGKIQFNDKCIQKETL